MTTEPKVCKHGQLQRSCEICELEADRDQWKERAKKAEKALDETEQVAEGNRIAWGLWMQKAEYADSKLAEAERVIAECADDSIGAYDEANTYLADKEKS